MWMYLVADIGGTHARFRTSDGAEFKSPVWIGKTAEYERGEALLTDALAGLGVAAAGLSATVLAVAGPVAGEQVTLTNSELAIESAVCAELLHCPVHLVNDFHALARGLPAYSSLEQFGGGPIAHGTKAVLGPGSGLGMAGVIPNKGGWQVVAGEGGHMDLAPGNHLESELWNVLTAKFGHVSWETVLCGPGLVNLYGAMCATWGSPAETLSPAEISSQGQDMSDLVCHQTLEVFAGLLGAAAGNLALMMGAKGGVYLAGGILPELRTFLETSPMRRRFDEKGAMARYVEEIPLLLIMDEQPGLLGAQACIQDL